MSAWQYLQEADLVTLGAKYFSRLPVGKKNPPDDPILWKELNTSDDSE